MEREQIPDIISRFDEEIDPIRSRFDSLRPEKFSAASLLGSLVISDELDGQLARGLEIDSLRSADFDFGGEKFPQPFPELDPDSLTVLLGDTGQPRSPSLYGEDYESDLFRPQEIFQSPGLRGDDLIYIDNPQENVQNTQFRTLEEKSYISEITDYKFYNKNSKYKEIEFLKNEYTEIENTIAKKFELSDDLDGSFKKDIISPAEIERQQREQREKARQQERAAHSFRSARMRLGSLGQLTRELQDDPAKSGISAIVRRAQEMQRGAVTEEYQLYRAYAPLIAGFMTDPVYREKFMDGIDEAVAKESDKLKAEAREQGQLEADVVIVGSGVQGAIFAARMRAEKPEARIIMIDEAEILGGQFRSYGNRPVFAINSRNHRRQDNAKSQLPGQTGNLNSFGVRAPIQLPDISTETYPSNIELGMTAAINGFMSAESMVGVSLVSARETDSGIELSTIDSEGNEYLVKGQKVVVATGLGDRITFDSKNQENVWTAEDVFRHFGSEDNMFPMDVFAGKKIAIVGGGDTGRVVAELLTRLGPTGAYGRSSVQLGNPGNITWYGVDFEGKRGYQESSRPRYQQLATFFRKPNERPAQDQTVIDPNPNKITKIEPNRGRVLLTEATQGVGGSRREYDVVIDCTNLRSDIFDPFVNISQSLRDVEGYVQNAQGFTTIARRMGEDIYFLGPVSQLPLTRAEQRTFAEGISENTVAIWANEARTNALAERLATNLRIGN